MLAGALTFGSTGAAQGPGRIWCVTAASPDLGAASPQRPNLSPAAGLTGRLCAAEAAETLLSWTPEQGLLEQAPVRETSRLPFHRAMGQLGLSG